jgi:hypothetical protein
MGSRASRRAARRDSCPVASTMTRATKPSRVPVGERPIRTPVARPPRRARPRWRRGPEHLGAELRGAAQQGVVEVRARGDLKPGADGRRGVVVGEALGAARAGAGERTPCRAEVARRRGARARSSAVEHREGPRRERLARVEAAGSARAPAPPRRPRRARGARPSRSPRGRRPDDHHVVGERTSITSRSPRRSPESLGGPRRSVGGDAVGEGHRGVPRRSTPRRRAPGPRGRAVEHPRQVAPLSAGELHPGVGDGDEAREVERITASACAAPGPCADERG